MSINFSPNNQLFSNGTKTVKPLYSINYEDNDTFLEWAKEAVENLEDDHRRRTENDMRNRDFYMGYQSMSLGKEGIPRDREGRPLEKFSRVTINQVYEMVEQWVSKMTRFAPAIAVLPSNEEYNDKIAAKLSKSFIDYLFYVNDVDELLEEAARAARIDGEVFLFIEWDKDKGDLKPDAARLKEYGVRLPVVDPVTGEPVLNVDGEPLFQDKMPRTGDVSFKPVLRRYVLRQPQSHYKDVEWVIKITSVDVDELKIEYPELADEIKTNSNDFLRLFTPIQNNNEVVVYELYHKSTPNLDAGRYIKFTSDVVLENTPLPYSHGEIPCVRLSNIDIPDTQFGMSFIDQIILLQVMYNNVASIAYTNVALGAHLYWLVDKSSQVNLESLRNTSSVIKYTGGTAPQIAQFKTIGNEIFQIMEFINTSILRGSAIQEVSRGEIPTGVEAGVAMAFLEEQENQRANTDIKKHNAFIKKVARLSLATAGDYYDPADQRTIRIVGKNNQFSVKALDVAKLGGSYDIRVQRTTALSESKSGRLSQILALEGRFPNMLPREQVLDMLDLSNDQKFYDLATVAVQTAEKENEDLADGFEVPPAELQDEHLVHWYSHVKFMQSSNFKVDMPIEVKQRFIDHVKSHEVLMLEKAQLNPAFDQKLLTLENFPIYMSKADYMMVQSGMTDAPIQQGGAAEAQQMQPQGNPAPTDAVMPMDDVGEGQALAEPLSTGEGQPQPPMPPAGNPEVPIQ